VKLSATDLVHRFSKEDVGIETTARDPGQNARMTRDYTYSPAGNILAKNTEHGVYTYQYDDLQRLTEALNPQSPDEAYTYDALGNRLSSAQHSGWQYNANNELLGYGDVTYRYDDNGNTVQKTSGLQTHHYIYDVEDRLVRIEDDLGSAVAQYYYDPFGRRLWKEVDGVRTCFLYSDEGLIGEFDQSGTPVRSYGWAPDSQWGTDPLFVKQDGSYYWYLNDHLGTPQQIIDTSGKVVWSAVYDSFGNCQVQNATIVSNLRFAGQYYDDETGLHYNLNRYYDPVIGRYLRVDPFGEGLNLYAYVFNNPNSLIDPLGLCVAHPILAGLGMIPIFGIVPDLIDAAWYLLEGNEFEAALSGAAAIPLAGLLTRGGQYLYKFGKWAHRSEKVKDFLNASWRVVDNQIGAIGDIRRIKKASKSGRNHLQDLFSIKRQKGLGDIPAGARADAETIGKAWVNGKDVKRFDLGDGGYGLTDGTRSFRLQYKPKDGVWKANFQENTFTPGRNKGIEVKNIHMTITDMVAP
jgi:RHS repeat-associated protein